MLDRQWSDNRTTRLRTLWTQGHTASIIAGEIGVSRNAVLGKVHRLGLESRTATLPQVRRAARRVPSANAKPRRPTPPTASRFCIPAAALPPAGAPGKYRCLEDLPAHACKWPIGDPKVAGFMFCGQDAGERSYCPGHAAIGVTGVKLRPLHTDRKLLRLFAA